MSFTTNQQQKHDKVRYRCYRIGQILYLPTYNAPKLYTSPSGKLYSEEELNLLGARLQYEFLWESKARDESR
jgi:hypothetical protein